MVFLLVGPSTKCRYGAATAIVPIVNKMIAFVKWPLSAQQPVFRCIAAWQYACSNVIKNISVDSVEKFVVACSSINYYIRK